MQTQEEVGKYVTDGKMTYPYNAYLDDLIAKGKLQFCARPATVLPGAPKPIYRSPLNYTADERLVIAQKLNLKLGDITNMSPQEFEAALVSLENPETVPAVGPVVVTPEAPGFPA